MGPNSVRATLRNLCTRMVESCQQIEKLHPHLQGTKPHFWMLAVIESGQTSLSVKGGRNEGNLNELFPKNMQTTGRFFELMLTMI